MRNASGTGSVYKLTGRRRRPWCVRVTTGWRFTEETAVQERKIIGYARTRKEAMEILADYWKDPNAFDVKEITVRECYERWAAEHFQTIGKDTAKNYKSSWSKVPDSIKDMEMSKIRLPHIKEMVDGIEPAGVANKAKLLLSLIFDWAIRNDIVAKNYPKLCGNRKTETKIKRSVFTCGEIMRLWDLSADPAAALMLIGIYTGMRPGELVEITRENIDFERWTITGGKKTAAGKNRVVPVHPDIRGLISEMEFEQVTYRTYNRHFADVCKKVGTEHLPHDTRHTFATLAAEAGMNEYIRKLILGHAIDDLTERVYTHRKVDELHKEVAKINISELSKGSITAL